MSDVQYEYMTEEEVKRELAEIRKSIHPHALAICVGEKGWVVAIQPGWRPCDKCQGPGQFGTSVCVANLDGSPACENGWIKV